MTFCDFVYADKAGSLELFLVCCSVPSHLGDHMLETPENRDQLAGPVLPEPLDPFVSQS